MTIFEALPFPFHDARGQDLVRALIALYPTAREALLLGEQHGISPASLPAGLTVEQLWHQLLERANVHGVTRDLVRAARDRHATSAHAPLLEALLAA